MQAEAERWNQNYWEVLHSKSQNCISKISLSSIAKQEPSVQTLERMGDIFIQILTDK